ncbi:MAG TPA: hypothetical protein VFF29_00400, partial [Bacteroidota bacterium]|nr:hypothetical protein [Bacteroidota bacterium]
LPMTPYLKINGRGEVDLDPLINIWSSFDFWTKQNVDRLGNQFLDPVILVGSGVVVKVIPRALFLFEIENMLNSAYQWWGNYPAPGRRLLLEAKVNLL